MEFFAPDILGLPKIELFSMPVWYWIFIFLLIIFSFFMGYIFSNIIFKIFYIFSSQRDSRKKFIFQKLNSPLRLFFSLIIFILCELYLDKPYHRELAIQSSIKFAGLFIFAHASFRIIDFLFEIIQKNTNQNPPQISLILFRHTLKTLIIILCGLITLAWCGVDIHNIFLGLGLSSLAVALALKPMLENLLSGVLLAWDNIFNVGESIQTNNQLGVVENVTMRSIKLRTFDGPLVTIPNSEIIKSNIINLSRRSHRRLKLNFKILRTNQEKTIILLLENLHEIIKKEDHIEHQSSRIGIAKTELYYYEIEIIIITTKVDINNFIKLRQQICLHIGILSKTHELDFPEFNINNSLYSNLDMKNNLHC